MHGYGIAERIRQTSGDILNVSLTSLGKKRLSAEAEDWSRVSAAIARVMAQA